MHIVNSLGFPVIADWDIQSDPSVGIRCDAVKEIERFEFIVRAVNAHTALEAQRDELLAASRKVEAHSFHNKFGERDDHYVVDVEAMDGLCEQIGKITKQVKRAAIAHAAGKS